MNSASLSQVHLIIRKIKTLDTLGRVHEDITARMNFDANYVFIAPGAKVSVANALME